MLCVLTLACTGQIGEPSIAPNVPPDSPFDPSREALPSDQGVSSAVPRLSRRELEHAIHEVFGFETIATGSLPPDARLATNPETGGEEEVFDTFAGTLDTYLPAEVFVQGIATLAFEVARLTADDTALVQRLGDCAPSDPEDACLERYIGRVGRRLYRRPLRDDETSRLRAVAAMFADASFEAQVRAVTQSLLQSPEFVYRVSVGEDEGDGLRRLDNFELLARVSFHLWGELPGEAWLDRAEGAPWDEEAYEAIVREMASDPRTDAQIRELHEAWIRHETLIVADEALAADMVAETNALIERALGDGRWSDLFTSEETFVTPALAAHYGIEGVDEPGWVRTENPERAGLLTHGAFLSLSSTQGNGTLPSRRGAILAERILCSPIPPPPPDVDIDDGVEVEEGACKSDAYLAHSSVSSGCAGCHSRMDPLGFGFERFDGLGVYRTTERLNPSCDIEGTGTVAGEAFAGPREFATTIATSGALTFCGTAQMMRHALRRPLQQDDGFAQARLHAAFVDEGEDFKALMVALALDPTFRYRKEAL